ncbi:MAG TPA: GNAT family N-acetyltransferase [Actinomycetota bacterium]
MTPAVRPATTGDAEELARLRWEFRIEAGTTATHARDAFEEHMSGFAREALEPGSPWRAWVAEESGRLVGCVWLRLLELIPHPGRGRDQRPIAYVSSMYVEPDRRNGGLGAALLEAALGFARERRAGGVILWPSERSRPFYQRAGFGRPCGPLWLELQGD